MPQEPNNLSFTDRSGQIKKALQDLAKTKVLVGIPSDTEQPHLGAGNVGTESRQSGPIGNAALGYIHENGSPINNIPARPFLGPGVKESQEKWINYLEQAAKKAFEGDAPAVSRALHAAGLTAMTAVKNKITAGIPPPLSPRTVAARKRRTPSRQATGPADVTPLVDTGQLLNSISYVIRKDR